MFHVSCLSFIVYCLLFIVYCLLFIVYCFFLFVFVFSNVICFFLSCVLCLLSFVFCLWSLVFGLWSLVFGLWSLVFCLWSFVFGLWSLVFCLLSFVFCCFVFCGFVVLLFCKNNACMSDVHITCPLPATQHNHKGLALCSRCHPAWASEGTPVGPGKDTHGTLRPGQRRMATMKTKLVFRTNDSRPGPTCI